MLAGAGDEVFEMFPGWRWKAGLASAANRGRLNGPVCDPLLLTSFESVSWLQETFELLHMHVRACLWSGCAIKQFALLHSP